MSKDSESPTQKAAKTLLQKLQPTSPSVAANVGQVLNKHAGTTNASVIWIHDGTHDAEWAAVCMTLLLVGLMVAILYSRMWKTKDDWVVAKTVVPKDDIFTPGPEMNIRQLIESKIRNLPTVVINKKKKRKGTSSTRMKYRQLSQLEERLYNSEGSGSEEELFIKHNGLR